MNPQDLVIIGNTVIMGATLIATLYRIKIEREIARVQKEETEYKKRVEIFKIMLDKERDEILSMTSEEIYDMLEKVWKN